MRSNNKWFLIGAIIAVMAAFVVASGYVGAADRLWGFGNGRWDFHTPIERWTEPRTFNKPFDHVYINRMSVSRDDLLDDAAINALSFVPFDAVRTDAAQDKVFSPNKAYWFYVYGEKPKEDSSANGFTYVYIFTEMDYSLRIRFLGHDPRHPLQIYWINEKLLYFSAWLSGEVGTYFVLDVEEEKVLIREMIYDGSALFQQWQEVLPLMREY